MLKNSIKCVFFKQFCCYSTASTSVEFKNFAPELPNNRLFVFETPQLTVPTFEISKRFGNIFTQSVYKFFFEKNFSVESLVRGANKGINHLSHLYADEKWDELENLVAKDTLENLKLTRRGLSEKLVNSMRFSPDDYIVSFLYSSIFSGRNLLKLSESKNVCVYFTIVSYVKLSENVPENASISQLNQKYKNDVLVCNATFSRVLNPLGIWKITSANFFI